jgi:hypothetical protein
VAAARSLLIGGQNAEQPKVEHGFFENATPSATACAEIGALGRCATIRKRLLVAAPQNLQAADQ